MDLFSWTIPIGIAAFAGSFGFTAYVHVNSQSERAKIAEADRVEREKLSLARERDVANLHARLDSANARIESAQKELYEFRINSAQLFATVTAVSEFRKEVMAGMRDFRTEFMESMKEIEGKLDRIAGSGTQRH